MRPCLMINLFGNGAEILQEKVYEYVTWEHLSEDGPISISDSQKVVKELCRVLKTAGSLWACVLGRYSLALAKVENNFEEAFELIKSELNYISYKGLESSRVFTPKELKNVFEKEGIEVIEVYGNRIVTSLLSSKVQGMKDFDDKFYHKIRDLELHLSEEPSLLRLAEYLQIVGEKI
jgi:hypothetical protein